MKRYGIILIILMAAWLAACRARPTPTPTPPPEDVPGDSQALDLPEVSVTPPPSVTPTPQGATAGPPTATPTPTATATFTPEPVTLYDLLSDDPELSRILGLAQVAGFTDRLKDLEAGYTFFAPVNSAFDVLPAGMLPAIQTDPEAAALLVNYHMIPVPALGTDLRNNAGAQTLLGDLVLSLRVEGGKVIVGEQATVIEEDRIALNGVIHLIDSLLLPPEAADQ